MSEELLTVDEVCQRLKVKRSWVYNNIAKIPHVRVGRYLRFYWSDVTTFINQRPSAVLGINTGIMRRSIETGEPRETVGQTARLEWFDAILAGAKSDKTT